VVSGTRHSKRRDRQAVSQHYDVGNDFYSIVLGESMTYSCAYWTRDDAGYGLADAQRDIASRLHNFGNVAADTAVDIHEDKDRIRIVPSRDGEHCGFLEYLGPPSAFDLGASIKMVRHAVFDEVRRKSGCRLRVVRSKKSDHDEVRTEKPEEIGMRRAGLVRTGICTCCH